jgi:hypothetical protein
MRGHATAKPPSTTRNAISLGVPASCSRPGLGLRAFEKPLRALDVIMNKFRGLLVVTSRWPDRPGHVLGGFCQCAALASVGKGPQRGARGGLGAPLGPEKKKAGFAPRQREFTGSSKVSAAGPGGQPPRVTSAVWVSRARRGPPSCPARQVAGPAERKSAHRPRYSIISRGESPGDSKSGPPAGRHGHGPSGLGLHRDWH